MDEVTRGTGILGSFLGKKRNNGILFFFLLLVVIFCNSKCFVEMGDDLLFFFLLLVFLFAGCGRKGFNDDFGC